MSIDELLRRGRSRAYFLRQNNQGFDAKLIEDLCVALETAAPSTFPTEAAVVHRLRRSTRQEQA